MTAFHGAYSDDERTALATLDTPIPDDLPQPYLWKVLVMPIGNPGKSRGGILFTDTIQEEQMWTHGIGRIAALGPLAFRSGGFARMIRDGVFNPEDHAPAVNDLIVFNPKSPNKIIYSGRLFQQISDDEISMTVAEHQAENFSFGGMKLFRQQPLATNVVADVGQLAAPLANGGAA